MKAETLKGHLDALILATLRDGPAHGYAVIEELKQRSGGAFELAEGTVYPVLHRLESDGLLSSAWSTAAGGALVGGGAGGGGGGGGRAGGGGRPRRPRGAAHRVGEVRPRR